MADNPTECPRCKSPDLFTQEKVNQIGLYCRPCGDRWIKWIPKSEQPNKRPKLTSGTADEVWAESKGYCAHCGLSEEQIEFLGLQRTVGHVPPFKVDGHDGYVIPLCSWCQQHSATQLKQLEALIARLTKKFSV
jgi:hypothetical protein